MSDTLDFENRVVIITGGGNGLGKAYALEMARRGAKVVVNDLARGDEQAQMSAAQSVVQQIVAEGGCAVANTDSVEQGARIVEQALDEFGKVDALINNAGILRDSSFHKLQDEDWTQIQDVHLNGAYAVTRAAWPHMRTAGFGRIVMTTSAAGIYGNFGQANYSAAKLGLFGLAQTLAIEGRSKNIHVNTIAPIAASQLTASVFPPEFQSALKPELVVPLTVYLAHASNQDSGQLFEVGGGVVTRLRWEKSDGVKFDPKTGYSVEDLAANWDQVQSFKNATHPEDASHTLQAIAQNLA